ncbi:hypothetical protein GCK72_000114 [Caenorhabditis remanei]|uniref:Uncharacterized protein n=1 Tax=Caenorhabditis remanei TaxID=31234 RepID=A0A6A5HRC9_CAERE|nr:hypothetical protein GCK72_000114 [Caenorhabditis remanei]KAF1768302.1 hypothetical protein GCK72_000114 [Caenorhabditis remanei]
MSGRQQPRTRIPFEVEESRALVNYVLNRGGRYITRHVPLYVFKGAKDELNSNRTPAVLYSKYNFDLAVKKKTKEELRMEFGDDPVTPPADVFKPNAKTEKKKKKKHHRQLQLEYEDDQVTPAAGDVVVPADAENQDNVDPGAEELQNDQSDSDGEEEPLVDFFADLEEITRNLGARGMRYIQRMEEVNLDNESADEDTVEEKIRVFLEGGLRAIGHWNV